MSSEGGLDLDRLARDARHFRRREVELAPAAVVRVDADAWRDAIVFVEAGEVEVECTAGDRRRFATGAVLCFAHPARVIRNCGGEPTRLLAISRRVHRTCDHTGEFPELPPSHR
jgi:hypothetical protein